MKKLLLLPILFILSINNVFAMDKEIAQTSDNTNKLLQFFTIGMLINIIFAIVAIILTLIISKIINSRIGAFIERG
jgi:hypothetical protein